MLTITQTTLAQRLRLLTDWHGAVGLSTTWATISESLQQQGIELSRARWAYMRQIDNTHKVTDEPLLAALAYHFGVPAAYLTEEDAPPPVNLTEQWSTIAKLRENQLAKYAHELLSVVSPEKLAKIEAILKDEA